ncbi:unnamed protein product [Effrenium voratum]|nr:unnamed protein product [Effrenium voratum]
MSVALLVAFLQLQLAAAAGPGLRGANESETREDLWHPWCSVSVSKRVRAHVDEGIKDVLPKLPANCPFHPRADLLNYSKGGSSSGHVCMASFCEMFGVCEEPSEICVDAQMAEQKRRCEGAVLRCFPPGDVDMSIRQKHSQFTRRCKELDCQVRAHRASEERAGLTSISPLLALVASSCLAAFAAMLLLVGGGDEFILFLHDLGVLPSNLVRSFVHTRKGLRKCAGLPSSRD